MVFTSGAFLYFFVLVYFIYLILPTKQQNIWLLFASYVFYGFWDVRFLGLMLLTSSFDFWCGLKIQEAHLGKTKFTAKHILVFSFIVNFGILVFFKYFNFFIDSLKTFLASLPMDWQPRYLEIVLPLGISFYTFQSVSYVIDVYRKDTKPNHNYFNFLLFVSFFPQLIAGPIERSKDLLSQIDQPRRISAENIQHGLWLILWGVFCKIFVANNLWNYTSWGIGPLGPKNGIDVWVIGVAWAFQFYCDFAGYSRIAQGLGLLMGFRLTKNFNFPYFSQSPFEYWRRWHITLSFWFRDYLYIPLKEIFKNHSRAIPLVLTFTLIGLWHGANWNFVFWGFSWGLVLSILRVAYRIDFVQILLRKYKSLVWVETMFTFALVILLNAQLVAENLSHGLEIQRRLLLDWTISERVLQDLISVLFFILPALALDIIFFRKGSEFFIEKKSWLLRACLYAVLIFLLVGGSSAPSHDFIYFQF